MKVVTLAGFLALILHAPAFASQAAKRQSFDEAVQAIPSPKENRIVRYTYSPDVIFRILTVPNLHTHIELGEDEGVKELPVIGDSAQWRVSGGPRNLYVKPLRSDLETSMTVVTNKRTYQFQLVAGTKEDSAVYQKVSFMYPDRDMEIKLRKEADSAVVEAEHNRLAGQIVASNVDPAALDFGFDIAGEAPFKPTAVYSDGKFTFLAMPKTQDSPAIFLLDDEGNPSLINYQVKANMIVVERAALRLMLKLGNVEVTITKRGIPNKKSQW